MNTTPDPEETEREALATRAEKSIKGLRYWGRAANNPAIRVDSSSAASVIEELLAARRVSESEMRREWGVLYEGDNHVSWMTDEDTARSYLHHGNTLWSRTPVGQWTKEADRG